MDIIKTTDLIFKYNENNSNSLTALNEINLSVPNGSFIAILGHNGSGKSTLAKHFNALLLPTGGAVFVNGLDTKNDEFTWEIRQCCGMVFQNPDNQIIATMVEEDVAFGLENLGLPSNEIEKRVEEALKEVDMESYRRSAPSHLSGGQKQRVAIAGIIAMRPKCIVFDEPTAMLDPVGRKGVLSAIDLLVKEGITVVLITHFMEEAIRANRVIVMDNGKIVMDSTPKNVFSNIEAIKKLSLDVPQMTELAQNLFKKGIVIPKDILTINEMVIFLKNYFDSSKLKKTLNANLQTTEIKEIIPAPGDIAIKIQNLGHVYSQNTPFEKIALKNINLEIEKGSFIGIIGHTGSGKSTLIQHLNILLKPTEGNIYINGEDINSDKTITKVIRRKVGLVFQYPEHQLFETTVFKDVAYGPINMGFSAEDVKERVVNALSLVDLGEDVFEKSPFNLSGGQKRRVAIAGVLAMNPEILILDEPTAGLDPRGRYEILNHINNLHKKTKSTIILVSHSMEDIARLVDKIIVLNEGEVKYTGTPKEVFAHAKELETIGLAAPQISYLVSVLNEYGINIKSDIITIDEATEEIYRRMVNEF